MTSFIARTVSATTVHVSNTTLFHLAATYLGDAMLWYIIASLNGLTDPWIDGLVELRIPPVNDLVSNGGILGV